MDNKYNILFSASFAEKSLNKLANNFLLTFIEDKAQRSQIEKLIEAFNRHGVSTMTILQAFADWYQEGGFDNGK